MTHVSESFNCACQAFTHERINTFFYLWFLRDCHENISCNVTTGTTMKKRKIEHGSSKLKTAGLADTGASFQRDDDDDDDYKSKKNIKIKKRKITDIVGESSGYEGNNEYRMADGYLVPVTGKKGARANDKDKNALRIQAQEAYRALRDSKRKF